MEGKAARIRMEKPKTLVYVVEDNDSIRETIVAYLQLDGHEVLEFPSVKGVAESLAFRKASLCIFDVMLPDGNGFSLAKTVRAQYPDIPFLFLTARESESDRITGLETGADDYVVKPFSPRELVLRVKAILRRYGTASTETVARARHACWECEGHELCMDDSAHTIQYDGLGVYLTPAEWNILEYLSRHPDLVISREQILGECLDYAHDGSERTVNTHLKNLRAKIPGALWIETLRGFGYKFAGKPKDQNR